MRYHSFTLVFVLAASMAAFSSCDKTDLFSGAPGEYQGTILRKKAGHSSQALVSARITAVSGRELQIQATESGSGSVTTLNLTAEDDNHVSLVFPEWQNISVALQGTTEKCFASEISANSVSATLCFNGTDLTIDLVSGPAGDAFTLAVSRASVAEHPVYEAPEKYSVQQLMSRAMTRNFDSPIAFEQVVQAELKTKTAYLDLIPHISLNGALNVAALNIMGVLKAVGDLVPFLFPTRWLQAGEAKYKSEAEFDAWILTKADAANVTEGLSYGVLRDTAVLARIAENQKYIAQIRDQVRDRERAGLMQAGASDDIESILNTIDRGSALLRNTLIQEKMALAQAAGFYNFAAITEVLPTDDAPIDPIEPYDDAKITKLADLAIDRSYERRQMGALIEAAKLAETERYFQWLDPSGDRDGALGLNLIPYVKIGASQTQELIDKREKLEAGLIEAVARSAKSGNQFLESYALARSGRDIQNRRVERHLNNMRSGVGFSMADLTNALQEKLKAEIELLNAQFAYSIIQGNLNRVLLTGPYAGLPTDRGEAAWIVSGAVGLR